MNMLQQTGLSWMQSRLGDCMFYLPDKTPALIDVRVEWRNNQIPYTAIAGPISKPVITKGSIEADYFQDFGMFRTPTLGWRSANFGRYLVYFRRRNNTYNRALSPKTLEAWVAPTTRFLAQNGGVSMDFYQKDTTIAAMVMSPNFKPFGVGLDAMRAGKVYSFCISPQIAIMPDGSDHEAIYFNTTRVGAVKPDRSVECYVPEVMAVLKDIL